MLTDNIKRKLSAAAIAVCVLLSPVVSFAGDESVRPRISFISFTPKSMEVTHLTETVPTILMTAIVQSGSFEIIEKKKTDSMIELSGCKIGNMKTDELITVSRKLNADFGLWGDITSDGGKVAVTIKLFDIHLQQACSEQTLTAYEGELNVKLKESSAQLVRDAGECIARRSAASGPIGASIIQPPAGLQATGGMKRIRLRWQYDDMKDISGFRIFKAKEEGGSYMLIDTVGGASFTDSNLSIDETAFYKIKAVGREGQESEFSSCVSASTNITPPPPIFMSVRPDIRSAKLDWRVRQQKGGKTETVKLRVYRKTSEESDLKEIASVAGENFTDRDLKDDTVYSYALTALNSEDGESDFSTTLEVKTLPPAAGLLTESGKIRRVALKWAVYPNSEAEGYRIYRSSDKDTGYKQIAVIRDRNASSYTDSSELTDNTTYWYKFSAYNADGAETGQSPPVSAVTRGKPSVPSGLAAKSGGPRRVTLQWDTSGNPDDEIKGYMIHRSDNESGGYKLIAKIDAEKKSFVDDNSPLKDKSVYYYKITSFNSANVLSDYSVSVSAATKAVPAVPQGLRSTSGEVKQVTLKWDPNPETDIREYAVYRKDPDGKDFEKIKVVRNVTTYIDSDLKDGSEYAFSVQAIDNDNLYSELSNAVTSTTKPRPQRPLNIAVNEQNGQKTLIWETNSEKDIVQYNVYKKGFLGTQQKLATVQGTSWIIDDTKSELQLYVTAVDGTGLESDGSDVVAIEKKK